MRFLLIEEPALNEDQRTVGLAFLSDCGRVPMCCRWNAEQLPVICRTLHQVIRYDNDIVAQAFGAFYGGHDDAGAVPQAGICFTESPDPARVGGADPGRALHFLHGAPAIVLCMAQKFSSGVSSWTW